MAEDHDLKATALTIGVIAVIAIGVGVGVAMVAERGLQDPAGGLLVRVGAVLGAIALIIPSIRKPSLTRLGVVAAALALVILRPGLIWAALIAAAGWLVLRRQPKTPSNDS